MWFLFTILSVRWHVLMLLLKVGRLMGLLLLMMTGWRWGEWMLLSRGTGHRRLRISGLSTGRRDAD